VPTTKFSLNKYILVLTSQKMKQEAVQFSFHCNHDVSSGSPTLRELVHKI